METSDRYKKIIKIQFAIWFATVFCFCGGFYYIQKLYKNEIETNKKLTNSILTANEEFKYKIMALEYRAMESESFAKQIAGNQYFVVGLMSYDNRQFEDAIESYNKAIELNPENINAYNNRGAAYSDLKQYYYAIADYDRVIKLNPDNVDTYYNRGNSYSALKRYYDAIADYNQVVVLNPSYIDVYNNRGVAYFYLKQYENAIKDYNRVLELNPDDDGAYYNLAESYIFDGQYKKALEFLKLFIQKSPEPFILSDDKKFWKEVLAKDSKNAEVIKINQLISKLKEKQR